MSEYSSIFQGYLELRGDTVICKMSLCRRSSKVVVLQAGNYIDHPRCKCIDVLIVRMISDTYNFGCGILPEN